MSLLPVCSQCDTIQDTSKYRVCSRCRSTYYCSVKCQRKAWSSHKDICTPSDLQYRMRIMVKALCREFTPIELGSLTKVVKDNYVPIMILNEVQIDTLSKRPSYDRFLSLIEYVHVDKMPTLDVNTLHIYGISHDGESSRKVSLQIK